jgi:hypothetical protein
MSTRGGMDFSARMHAPAATGGLEDLFGDRDEPLPLLVDDSLPTGRRRSWIRWLVINVLVVAGMAVVAVATLRSADVDISVIFVVTALIALRLVLLAVEWVKAPSLPGRSAAGRSGGDSSGTDALRAAVRRWERNLQWAHDDPDRYSRNLLPVLTELADERLRLRHGITRESDPRRARQLLGDPLWAALHDRGRHVPKARDLESYVDSLEKL